MRPRQRRIADGWPPAVLAVGLSILVGLLLGLAGGGFVRARSLEWRATAVADTLAPWRTSDRDARPSISHGEELDLLPSTTAPAATSHSSDFERGYAWAERESVRSAAECESYSWSYQRGCLTWLRGARLDADILHP